MNIKKNRDRIKLRAKSKPLVTKFSACSPIISANGAGELQFYWLLLLDFGFK